MAIVPAAMREGAPLASAAGGWGSAETPRDAALCADIGQPPFLCLLHIASRDRREDLLQALAAVALQQLPRLALLDEAAVVQDRQALAVAFGLLHHVGREQDRGAGLRAQVAQVLPYHSPGGRIEAHGGLVQEQD